MTFHLVIPILGVGYKSALILIPFYSCVILIIWSYYQAVFTEPGIVDMDVVGLHGYFHFRLKELMRRIQMQSIIIDARRKENLFTLVVGANVSNHFEHIIADGVRNVF